MKSGDPHKHDTVTILHYIGCKLEGYTNLPATCCPAADSGSSRAGVVSADVDSDLRHLASGHHGTWRFPEELIREWRQHADEALAQAAEALGDAVVLSQDGLKECGFAAVRGLEHLGVLVNFKTRTLLRRGYDEQQVTLKAGPYWDAFRAIVKEGAQGVRAEGMQKRYGANDACRSAVGYLRKRLEPLDLWISDRVYAIVDVKEYTRR